MSGGCGDNAAIKKWSLSRDNEAERQAEGGALRGEASQRIRILQSDKSTLSDIGRKTNQLRIAEFSIETLSDSPTVIILIMARRSCPSAIRGERRQAIGMASFAFSEHLSSTCWHLVFCNWTYRAKRVCS